MIAIGYDDMETADKAAEEVYRLAQDLVIEPEAVAVIVRDEKGRYHIRTNHHPVAEGVTWGVLWGALFGLLFLVGVLERVGVGEEFQAEVRDMVKRGTSALFLVVEKVTPDKAIQGLSKYGGRVLKSSLSSDGEHQLPEPWRVPVTVGAPRRRPPLLRRRVPDPGPQGPSARAKMSPSRLRPRGSATRLG